MAKVSPNSLENIYNKTASNIELAPQKWEDENNLSYSGKAIREAILKEFYSIDRDKIGYIFSPRERDKFGDNNFHLLGFKDRQTYDAWVEEGELNDSELILTNTALGDSSVVYKVSITSNIKELISSDGTIKLPIKAYSTITDLDGKIDSGENIELTFYARKTVNDEWGSPIYKKIIDSSPSDDIIYTENDLIDISGKLENGEWMIRVEAYGLTTETTALPPLNFSKVIKTNLLLEPAFNWEYPIYVNEINGTLEISLPYRIGGSVNKTLHIRIDNGEGTWSQDTYKYFSFPIGSKNWLESPFDGVYIKDNTTDIVKIIKYGVHNVEAWLTVDGNEDVLTEHVYSQIMIDVDSDNKGIMFVVNNLLLKVDNYTQKTLFGYSIHNPDATSTPIHFKITNRNKETIYLLGLEILNNDTTYYYSNMFEIEDSAESITTYLNVYHSEIPLIKTLNIVVDNKVNFSPTSGADFVLNPKTRSNNSDDREIIKNYVTDKVVNSTFTNFGFATDGWVLDEDNIRVLRVPSGSNLTIDYEPYTLFIGVENKRNSLTIEFDFKSYNIVDRNAEILLIGSGDNPFYGLKVKALEGLFKTGGLLSDIDLNFFFLNGVRTHVAINIVYNLYSKGKNYIRIFINGVINREIAYSEKDTFVNSVDGIISSNGIRIGGEGADIDIYGIRVYKKMLSADDIRLDYMSTFPTTEEKIKFRDANDILNDYNRIDYIKTSSKYNTLLWEGKIPYSLDKSEQIGNLIIKKVGDPAHSGTMNNIQIKGLGTSSMTYYKWNALFKTSYTDNTGKEIKTDFIDELGKSHGNKYQLRDDMPWAKKLCWKINFASSMQSHKMGGCNSYTALWHKLVGNSITEYTEEDGTRPYSNVRASIGLDVFMLFNRENEGDDPEFYALVTFGPAKGDKPTFGSNLDIAEDMLMIEGSDNGCPLTEFRVPWDDSVIYYEYKNGEKKEKWYYNDLAQFGYGFGNLNSLPYFINAHNFVYEHNINIAPFEGTYESLLLSVFEDDEFKATQYWVTLNSARANKYDLFRWDFITRSYVPAGADGTTHNLASKLGFTPSGDFEEINEQFISRRILDFKENIGTYFNVRDTEFSISFKKLEAATDNRAKNTYMVLDPITHKIGWEEDDIDTIKRTNNVGKLLKPYYIEELDLDSNGTYYWNGYNNVFFNVFEAAFESELKIMTYNILSAMAELEGSVEKFYDKYFFSILEAIPAVAYNETARLLYEEAYEIHGTGYSNATNPITQSLGNQLQSERQWVKDRLIYMSSYAAYGLFGGSDGNALYSPLFRSGGGEYRFLLTPDMWLYPGIAIGSTNYGGRFRVKPGQLYEISGLASPDNNIGILGIDYYRDIGNFSGHKVLNRDSFMLSSKYLLKFISDGDPMNFTPGSASFNLPLAKEFRIKDNSYLVGNLDLSSLLKCEIIDLRGTSLTSVTLPKSNVLKEVYLPTTITRLELTDIPNLQKLDVPIGSLTSLKIGESVNNEIKYGLIKSLSKINVKLAEFSLHGINLELKAVDYLILEFLSNITTPDVTGTINALSAGDISVELKNKLITKYGNIDDPGNNLYIKYRIIDILNISISCTKYFNIIGSIQPKLQLNPVNGNSIKSVIWSISALDFATIDKDTGEVLITKIGDADKRPTGVVSVLVTLLNGTILTSEHIVIFYTKKPEIGDYVYHDGTWSDELDPHKRVVGICFYVNSRDKVKLMVATKDIVPDIPESRVWGVGSNYGNGIMLEDGVDCNGKPLKNGVCDDSPLPNQQDDTLPILMDYNMLNSPKERLRSLGYIDGDYIPRGLYNCAMILDFRDKILTQTNQKIPLASDPKDLYQDALNCIRIAKENNMHPSYYPCMTISCSYQPAVPNLHPKFTAGNWWLPCYGELWLLFYYYEYRNINVANTDIGIEVNNSSVQGNIEKYYGPDYITDLTKANALGKAFNTGYLGAISGWHWSSSEADSGSAWLIRSPTSSYNNGKSGQGGVRAVCAF